MTEERGREFIHVSDEEESDVEADEAFGDAEFEEQPNPRHLGTIISGLLIALSAAAFLAWVYSSVV